MHIRYDPEADAAYITVVDKIAAGEVHKSSDFIDTPNGTTQVVIDTDSCGYLLGFEILWASHGLRKEVLEAAERTPTKTSKTRFSQAD